MDRENMLLIRLNKLRNVIESESICSHDDDSIRALKEALEEDNRLAEETP